MHRAPCSVAVALVLSLAACSRQATVSTTASPIAATTVGPASIARIYYWRALPGKLDEYSRYIRDVAERIDAEAGRAGAFVSVTTLISQDPASPWTHMRIFLLRDSAQLAGLSAALARAGEVFEPDSAKRRMRGEYSATLREAVGSATLDVLR